MGRNLQLSRPTTPYGLICAPPLIGHRAQNEDLFVSFLKERGRSSGLGFVVDHVCSSPMWSG